MPRGYRRYVLAVVGWLILTAAKNEHGQRHQTSNETHAQAGIASAPIIEPTASTKAAYPTQPQCVNKAGQSDDCTRASTQAAIDQASYAFWQAIAGGIGVFFGGLTLIAAFTAAKWAKSAAIHTKTAAQEAKRAANEAQIANGLTNQSQRPWIIIKLSDPQLKLEPRDRAFFSATIDIKNIGSSVAHRTSFSINVVEWFNSPQDFDKLEYAPVFPGNIQHDIAPSDTISKNVGNVGRLRLELNGLWATCTICVWATYVADAKPARTAYIYTVHLNQAHMLSFQSTAYPGHPPITSVQLLRSELT